MRRIVAVALLVLAAQVAIAQAPAPAIAELWREACLWEVGSNVEKVPAARRALIERGDEALEFLIPGQLDTKDTLVTRALSVVVVGIKGTATERLRLALAHEKPNVRRNAADLLGQLGDVESATSIARLLDDPDTRGGALTALGALKAQDAVPSIVALLSRRDGLRERDRVLAAATLGNVGGADAQAALVAALSHEEAQVRHAAQAALEKLKAWRELLPLLAPATEGRARLHAIAALGTIADPGAAASLLPLLGDPDALVRGFAAEALGRLKRPEDLAPLTAALVREADPFARGKLAGAVAGR